jgi:hypothetical protein
MFLFYGGETIIDFSNLEIDIESEQEIEIDIIPEPELEFDINE